MAGKRCAIIDLADWGAAALCGKVCRTRLNEDGESAPKLAIDQYRSICDSLETQTLLYPAVGDGTGRPFRTGLGIGRPLRGRESVKVDRLPGSKGGSEAWSRVVGQAIGQLGRQLTRERRPRVGVLSADQPDLTAADVIIREAQRREYRADVTMIPWSVAMAAYWRDKHKEMLESEGDKKLAIACILRRHGRLQAACVYLIRDGTGAILPLRDYDVDQVSEWEDSDASRESLKAWIREREDWAGMAVGGGEALKLRDAIGALSHRDRVRRVGHLVLDNKDIALGASALMASVMREVVPYYASLPHVELCGYSESIVAGSLGRPVAKTIEYWFDCLSGKAETVEGHRVVPANHLIEWMSDGSGLDGGDTTVVCGAEASLQVRLHGREVRGTSVKIGGRPGQQVACRYGCALRLGSGRPTVFVSVPSLEHKFILQWDRLERAGEPAAMRLDHVHGDEEVRRELGYRKYYTTWFKNRHPRMAGKGAANPNPLPGNPPKGFDEWRRRFSSGAPNPCQCRWCRS